MAPDAIISKPQTPLSVCHACPLRLSPPSPPKHRYRYTLMDPNNATGMLHMPPLPLSPLNAAIGMPCMPPPRPPLPPTQMPLLVCHMPLPPSPPSPLKRRYHCATTDHLGEGKRPCRYATWPQTLLSVCRACPPSPPPFPPPLPSANAAIGMPR